MDEALVVSVCEGVSDLASERKDLADGKLFLSGEQVAQGFAPDVRHDTVDNAVGFTRAQYRNDVGVVQLRGDLDLTKEAIAAQDGTEYVPEHLDGYEGIRLGIVGEIHGGHAATSENGIHPVAVTQCDTNVIELIGQGGASDQRARDYHGTRRRITQEKAAARGALRS